MKRLFDFIISASALFILLPVLVFTALIVRMKLGTPVIFKQLRPGLDGKPFYLYKFRTMTDKKDANGQPLSDELRLTNFGKILRKYSLDELPQLINVVFGDISLVGPRPLLMEYLSLYNEQQARRHEVRPGITGWAQVNGRNAISWEDKFKYDVWYVENHSFWLDLKILWLTALKVIKSEGINQQGQVTVEKFKGTNLKRVMNEVIMKKLVVIGDGGHSKVVKDIVKADNKYECIGTLDDKFSTLINADGKYYGPIQSVETIISKEKDVFFLIAVGDNLIRKNIVNALSGLNVNFASLIHPSAIIGSDVEIKPGTVIMPSAIINSSTIIQEHCIINSNVVIEHDNIIGSYVHISPGATLAGNVTIQEGTHIGIGANIIPSINIGEWTVVGAGGVVIKALPSNCTAVGNPTRIIKMHQSK
jgi:sugar O-acyltransferase (sialic acid O-acetyltransferase NeuD family)